MIRCHGVSLAALGAGLLAATGTAAVASPVEQADHLTTAKPRALGPGERFYRIFILYKGELTTLQKSGEARDLREEVGTYRVRSQGPIRLTAYCIGSHLTLQARGEAEREFLRELQRMRGSSCKEVRKLAQREFKRSSFRGTRTVFPQRFWRQFNRTAREAYEFDQTRAVSLVGLHTGGKLTRTVEPITRNGIACRPPSQVTTRTQTDPQVVNVKLLSGSLDNGRRGTKPITPFTGTTTQSGVRLRSEPTGQSGFTTEIGSTFCPRSDGTFDLVGGEVFSGSRTLVPLDSATLIERIGSRSDVKLLEHALAFTSMETVRPARSKLGSRFKVRNTLTVGPDPVPLGGPTRLHVISQRHIHNFTFTPCPKAGTVRRGC